MHTEHNLCSNSKLIKQNSVFCATECIEGKHTHTRKNKLYASILQKVLQRRQKIFLVSKNLFYSGATIKESICTQLELIYWPPDVFSPRTFAPNEKSINGHLPPPPLPVENATRTFAFAPRPLPRAFLVGTFAPSAYFADRRLPPTAYLWYGRFFIFWNWEKWGLQGFTLFSLLYLFEVVPTIYVYSRKKEIM